MATYDTLMVDARTCLASGDEKQAGRLMLEAVDRARTPAECRDLEQAAHAAALRAGLLKRSRFKSAADLARSREQSLLAQAI